MFPVSHLNLHDTPKIWCRRRGQSGSPIGCEGLYFHAMYKNRVLVSGWSSISCEGFHTNLNIPSLLPTTLVFRWFCRLLMSSLSQSILTNLRWKPQIAMYVQVRTIILQTHFFGFHPTFRGPSFSCITPSSLWTCTSTSFPSPGEPWQLWDQKENTANDGLKWGTPGVILWIWKCRFKDPILEAKPTKLIYSKPWCKDDKKPAKWIRVHLSSSHFGGFWRTSRHGQVWQFWTSNRRCWLGFVVADVHASYDLQDLFWASEFRPSKLRF